MQDTPLPGAPPWVVSSLNALLEADCMGPGPLGWSWSQRWDPQVSRRCPATHRLQGQPADVWALRDCGTRRLLMPSLLPPCHALRPFPASDSCPRGAWGWAGARLSCA